MFIKYKLEEETTEGAGGAAAATTAAQPPATGTTDTGTATGTETTTTQTWPSNWRELYADGDEKELKRLARFTAPPDTWRSFRSLENQRASGELKANVPFPTGGSPEQQQQWRAEHGVPEAPDKYDLKLPEGAVIGEFDKPAIDSFLKRAHEKNLSADVVAEAVNWYFDQNKAIAEERQAIDTDIQRKAEDTLRTEWGPEYRQNLNMINGLLATAPEGVKEKFLNGRLADGTPIGSDPDVLRFLAQLSREINPVTTLVPGAGANMAQAVNDEITKIENFMRTNRSEYNRDEKMQARYRELIDAKSRIK